MNVEQQRNSKGDSLSTCFGERFGYNYDAAWNLERRTNNTLVQTFNCDNLNQLTAITRTVSGVTWGPATNVTVADNGNSPVAAARYTDNTFARTNVTLLNGTNTFTAVAQDSAGRTDTNTTISYLPSTNSYAYDGNGNLTTNGTRVFEYDDENQLTRITEPTAWKSEFTYDGKMRRRIRKEYVWQSGIWNLQSEIHYIYDGKLPIQERWFNPQLSTQTPLNSVTYTRGRDLSGSLEGAGGIGGLLARTDSGRLAIGDAAAHAYYQADGNGNITLLLNTNQALAARYAFDPYGNTLAAVGLLADANLYRFSSKEWHDASGLAYYLYRHYAGASQRWVNRDPLQDIAALAGIRSHFRNRPLAVVERNLYQSLGGDPVNLIDSDGRFALLVFCAIVAGVVVCTTGCRKKPPPPVRPERIFPNCWDETPLPRALAEEKFRDCNLCCTLNFGGVTPEGGDNDALEACLAWCSYLAQVNGIRGAGGGARR